MKILLITNNYPLSTTTTTMAAFCIRELALALARHGAEVTVLAPEHVGEQELEAGVAVRRFPWSGRDEAALINLGLNIFRGLRHAISLMLNGRREVIALQQEIRPDVCLAAWALPSGYFARYGKKKLGTPYAIWCLGSDIHTLARKPLFRSLTRRVLADADQRYADGFALAREAANLCGLECEFLATSRPMQSGTPESAALESGRTHFLFVGRWERVKGLDVLLKAWRCLLSRHLGTDTMLHIVGQGQGLEHEVEMAREDPITRDSLKVAGWVTKSQLASLYAAADCVVIPSRMESIPVVFSEALFNDKPLIVSNVGDMGEMVERYRLGRVVTADSVADLTEALAGFIEHGHAFEADKLVEVKHLFDVDESARRFLADASSLVSSTSLPCQKPLPVERVL